MTVLQLIIPLHSLLCFVFTYCDFHLYSFFQDWESKKDYLEYEVYQLVGFFSFNLNFFETTSQILQHLTNDNRAATYV